MPHAYNTVIRGRHQTAAVRSSLLMAPDSPLPSGDGDELATVLPFTSQRPERDGAERVGALVRPGRA